MNGLSCGEEIMTIYSAILIGCQRVTDGRTDRQTDGRTDGRQAYSYYVLTHVLLAVAILLVCILTSLNDKSLSDIYDIK